ncbi:MAG: hypothetical protein KGL35_11400 [Bradyrhizobium sp.]|nr:hypothetical protein [Bradyrhizobium sp.]
MEATERENLPKYRILNSPGFYAEDDTLYPPGTEIYYTGTPTEHWQPLNEAAEKRLADHLRVLDEAHMAKLRAEGKVPYPRPRELGDQVQSEMEARPREPKIYPVAGEAVPVMGNMKRKVGRPRNLVSATTPKPAGKPKAVAIINTPVAQEG